MIDPIYVAVVLGTGLLTLLPARRLSQRGWSSGAIGTYVVGLWLLGIVTVALGGRGRLLLPVIAVAWLLPFVTWRAGWDRLVGRAPREVRPPMKDVTPPEEREAMGRR